MDVSSKLYLNQSMQSVKKEGKKYFFKIYELLDLFCSILFKKQQGNKTGSGEHCRKEEYMNQ